MPAQAGIEGAHVAQRVGWVPACAGTTGVFVMPEQAGIQQDPLAFVIPAQAGIQNQECQGKDPATPGCSPRST
jgi:hypothetical protein